MKKILGFFNGISEMIKILWQSSKVMTLLMIFNNLIRNALWPLRALVVKKIVDIIILSSENGFSTYQNSFWVSIILFFLLFWSNRIWWPLNSYTQTLMLAKISNKTRLRIISVMERIHLSFFDYAENSDTYTRALAQADDRQPINTVNSVIGFVSLIISFVTAFTVMISINIPVTVMLMLSSIPAVIWEGQFNKKIYNFDQEATREKRLLGYLFSLFLSKASSKEIRTFKTARYLSEKHESALKEYNHKYFRLINLRICVDSFFWLILQCALMIGYFLIISDAASGKIALGSLSFFLAVAGDLQRAIKNFGSSFNGVIQSNKYFDNLLQFEKQNAGTANLINYINIPETIETIEFRNVSFSYPNAENETLKDISFTLHCPQSAVLVGENGSGKTTLAKIILGLYHPQKGTVKVNGCDITAIPESFRYGSVCFQDYCTYSLSVRENVAFGKISKLRNDEDIYNAIDMSRLERSSFDNNIDRQITKSFDSNGIVLSGGQSQKLSLARAFLFEYGLIVLDEPSASLDVMTENEIFDTTLKLMQGRTSIVITHRLANVVHCDRIVYLDSGRICEEGTHKELMKKNGKYAELFSIQAKKYIS